jgi:hypothetical protein
MMFKDLANQVKTNLEIDEHDVLKRFLFENHTTTRDCPYCQNIDSTKVACWVKYNSVETVEIKGLADPLINGADNSRGRETMLETTVGTWNRVWTTKDGQKIPVRKLTDSHLHNLIKFMEKQHHGLENDAWATAGVLSGERAVEHAENYAMSFAGTEYGGCPCEACEWKEVFESEVARRVDPLDRKDGPDGK